jgi:hypothetical protein
MYSMVKNGPSQLAQSQGGSDKHKNKIFGYDIIGNWKILKKIKILFFT